MGLPLALGAIGTGISAIGAIGQGASASAEANYQAEVARNNASIAGQNANYALQAGETQTYDVGVRERQKAGQITTGLAASNLDINTGSAANVRKSQAELGQLSEERTMSNAGLTAYGYRTQSTNFQAESQLESAAAPRDVLGGGLTALGTLASGASNLGFKWKGLSGNGGAY